MPADVLVKTYDLMVGVQVKWSRERGKLIWRDLEISDLQSVCCYINMRGCMLQ